MISGYWICTRRFCFLFLLVFFIMDRINGQNENLHMEIGTLGGYISKDRMPFWLRSNQSGSIPLDNLSIGLTGIVTRDYDTKQKGIFDWGTSLKGRLNAGNIIDFILVEGYVKTRIWIFEIRGGRSREIMGLCDTSLTSGAFAVSGNAPGIPNIQINVPEFYTIPVFGELFAFKGNYVHGWIGETPVRKLNDSIANLKTYLHQKSLYGRFGKPGWKWKLYGGFSHQAFWGSEKIYYGSNFTLTPFEAYLYIITGRPYGAEHIPTSKIGNQLGSIDVGAEYNFENTRIMAYHQFIYDIGALYYLANIRDGLNGLSIMNTGVQNKDFHWKKILIEFFYTKNQAGELWSPFTPSGDENYYNNDQYINGWSYKGIGIGNPLICSRAYTREGLAADPGDYFINNRVVALHLGFEGGGQRWDFIIKNTLSLNYGTFGTSEAGHTLGKIRTLPVYGLFGEKKQFSGYFEINRSLKEGLNIGLTGAFDAGELYMNSAGFLLKFSKEFK